MTSRVFFAVHAGTVVAFLALGCAGCDRSSPSDAPKIDDKGRDEKRIEELSKKGYDFNEIRSIMNGEDPKPKARTKKKSVSAGR